MTPERWRQIKDVFQAALERGTAERDAFLTSSCGDDASLRCEVESMIAAHRDAARLVRLLHSRTSEHFTQRPSPTRPSSSAVASVRTKSFRLLARAAWAPCIELKEP